MTNNYNNVPEELKETDNWVGWRREERNGKLAKVPISPVDGKRVDTTNPQTWGTFSDALSAYKKFKLDGIGFVFTSENPYVGIDIDHCIDENGNMNEVARDIILRLNSYVEISPSGTGVHILCKGQLPEGKKRDSNIGLEMYSEKRYFTVTGNIIPGSPSVVEERSEALRTIHEEYLGDKGNPINQTKEQESEERVLKQDEQKNSSYTYSGLDSRNNCDFTDEEIIEKAKRAKRGEIFESLFSGNWQGYYKSWSDAEISFANMLAFWTARDSERMDRIYRKSELKRAKWDEKRGNSTYGQLVINKAIVSCTKVYDRQIKERKKIDRNYLTQEKRREFEKEENVGSRDKETTGFNEPKVTKPNQSPWYQILHNGNLKFLPAVLSKYLSKNIPVVYADGQAYKYENGVYSLARDIELDLIIKDHLRDDHATMYAIRDVRQQWMIECSRDQVEFDLSSLSHIINLKNGLYDIEKQRLLPHTPEHHSLVQINCSYEPNAKCEQFMEFINEVLPPESVILAQEILGYILVPMTVAQKSFVIYGPGGTGKSTFIRVVESLVGKQNVSNISWQDLTEKFLLARLAGKLLNTFADLPDKALKDLGTFKSLTGEDRVTADIKFKDPFEFLNTARFLFSANHLPQNLGDNSYSFYRRIIILPFENRISNDKVDARLTEKLVDEKNGVFLWALEGLNRLIKNKFKFSENEFTQKILAKYQRESSSVRWFIENNCKFDSNEFVECLGLYEQYKKSCFEDGIKPVGRPKFINEIEETYGHQVSKGHEGTTRRAIWRGIKLL